MQEKRKKRKNREIELGRSFPSQDNIRREKERARHLRQTAWWTRKIREGVCHYCGKKVGVKNLTMDHVIPLSRGGKSLKGNIVPSCKECNNKKKYLIPLEWDEYLNRLSVSDQESDSLNES